MHWNVRIRFMIVVLFEIMLNFVRELIFFLAFLRLLIFTIEYNKKRFCSVNDKFPD